MDKQQAVKAAIETAKHSAAIEKKLSASDDVRDRIDRRLAIILARIQEMESSNDFTANSVKNYTLDIPGALYSSRVCDHEW